MKNSGSKGILEGLNLDNERIEEFKNVAMKEGENEGSEELCVKRSYALKFSTIKKIHQLKLEDSNLSMTYNEIVDKAICFYYESMKK